KTIELAAGDPGLSVRYELEDAPPGVCFHFAAEINLAGMAGHQEDRYYSDNAGTKLGMLDERLDLHEDWGLLLADRALHLSVALSWSKPARLWCLPIETVSQNEGGIEGVYQSSAVIPHWLAKVDESGHWEVAIRWTFDRAVAINDLAEPCSKLAA